VQEGHLDNVKTWGKLGYRTNGNAPNVDGAHYKLLQYCCFVAKLAARKQVDSDSAVGAFIYQPGKFDVAKIGWVVRGICFS
jgi:hypothetical protein